MRVTAKHKVLRDNPAIKVWKAPGGQVIAQGKRVRQGYALSKPELRTYVLLLGNNVQMVKYLMDSRCITLAKAVKIMQEAGLVAASNKRKAA